ncbi:TPA: hypothetical protein ACXIGC_001224 [Stenotrophomonas maltophilia]|uniref:hypothetical protein n=1 Tax=Stenotrophomonas maltophilia TaxID=40324 RepID=UPI000C16240A|nr:hypothetical protein [Stenotrophomonas maltophilia]HEL5579500.1 hypothetical protein [Stenotrophomonas maltophilia]
MNSEPSTLFAPGILPGPDGTELLPMPADIQAIYDAAQRNTPFSKDVDDALAAHRNTHGEPEQIEHAQRIDPSDAMPIDQEARLQAYARQRRYAIWAGVTAGLTPEAIAQALGVSHALIRGDLAAMDR